MLGEYCSCDQIRAIKGKYDPIRVIRLNRVNKANRGGGGGGI